MDLTELQKTIVPCGEEAGKTFDQADLLKLDLMRDDRFLPTGFREKLIMYLEHDTISAELDRLLEG